MEECLHSERFEACPAQSFFALTAELLALSSPPPVSSCPLRLWHEANSSSTPPHLAIAVEEPVAAPWLDLEVAVQLEEVAVQVVAVPWLPVEAGHDGVSTSAVLSSSMVVVVGETCWWQE